MSWLKLILGMVSLAQWLTRRLHDSETFAAGQTKAVADAFQRASDEVSAALAAGQQAEKDAEDGKFDEDLFRKD